MYIVHLKLNINAAAHFHGNCMQCSMDKARVCGMRPAPAAPCYLEAELCSAVKV